MRYRSVASNCYRMIPVKLLDQGKKKSEEGPKIKRIINEICNMNGPFLKKRAGQIRINPETKQKEYFDVPHVGLKLLKRDGKIHFYVNLPKDAEARLKETLWSDLGGCKFEPESLEMPNENLTAFAVQGHPHLILELEKEYGHKIKSLFKLAGKDQLMYSLTMKEVENHDSKRKELTKRLAGINPGDKKSVILHGAKHLTKTGFKMFYDFWVEEETKEKHKQMVDQIKAKLPRKEKHLLSKRKVQSDKNRFMLVQVLFLLWTDQAEKVQQFKSALQKWMEQMKGENQLDVIEVKPDLSKVAKGQIQYDLPTLCLYQKELSQFLYLPTVEEMDQSFYVEMEQKTQIPEIFFRSEPGAIAFARELYSNRIVYMPRPMNRTELDSRVKGTIAVGEQGSGKTSYLENQILETFLAGARTEFEWRRNGRSVIAFDVADGSLIKNVRKHIPPWAQHNVVILNHADTENPIPVNFHDVIKINRQSRSIRKQIADTETKILLDSVGDDSKTVAVERYFKAALQASYEVGKGNLIDALQILRDKSYFAQILEKLKRQGKRNLVEIMEENAEDMENDASVLKTIKNRLVPFMTDEDFVNMIAQEENPEIDFWKWTNTGPYLVLIYLPGSGQEISLELRKFLFTHYFMKIWMIMLARERIDQEKRKECLVIVDELHQVIDQRAVQNLFGALFKEPRKYRFRYLFTIHGWSSLDEAGKNAEKLKRSIKDARPNLVVLKGGEDFFKSAESLLSPYNMDDFQALMNMEYTGIFRIDVAKKTHTFMAKLLEPAEMRLPVYQEMSLQESRGLANPFGRPREEVERKIYGFEEKKEEKSCNKNSREALNEEIEMITSGNAFQKAN